MAWRWLGLSMLCLLAACGDGGGASAPDAGPHDAGAQDAATQGARCSADPSACTLPPKRGSEPPNKGGTLTVMAISKLYLGDTDRWGYPDPNAWKSYGYNLDGLISKATDSNHCAPLEGWTPDNVKKDGEGGIDNSFGENVLPVMQAVGARDPIPVQQAIADGRSTVLFRIDNLRDSSQKPDQNGITGAIYDGADKGSVAAFDGSDVWPVTNDSVVGGNMDAPKDTFSSSYVSGGVWVAHSSGFVLPIVTPAYSIQLPIRRAVITMRIHGAGATATAADGVIAGVVDQAALLAWVRTIASTHDPGMCHPLTFESTAQQVRAAADIMSDESNGNAGLTCDAISIGIGFEATAAKLGPVVPPAPPPSGPCTP